MGGLVIIPAYFLPALIGCGCRHRQAHAIMAVNLLWGWTFVGWVVSLVWTLAATFPLGVTPGRAARLPSSREAPLGIRGMAAAPPQGDALEAARRWALILAALLGLGLLLLRGISAAADERVRCRTRWDAGLQRYLTECTDGSRAISRYDAGMKQWRTDITKPGRAGVRQQGK